MSPGERTERLRQEVRGELVRVGRVVTDLAEASKGLAPGCPGGTRMAVAGYLHGFYTGCEAVLTRIARAAGDLPTGDAWHQALLVRSTAPIEGVRPPVVSPETATALHDLLRFRHFFRASYGVAPSSSKAAAIGKPCCSTAPAIWPRAVSWRFSTSGSTRRGGTWARPVV